LSIKTITSIS